MNEQRKDVLKWRGQVCCAVLYQMEKEKVEKEKGQESFQVDCKVESDLYKVDVRVETAKIEERGEEENGGGEGGE